MITEAVMDYYQLDPKKICQRNFIWNSTICIRENILIKQILSVIHYTICGAVCFQFTHFPCYDWHNLYILCLVIIRSEVWIITHCLGIGQETMVCVVCLFIFLMGSCVINHFFWTYFPVWVLSDELTVHCISLFTESGTVHVIAIICSFITSEIMSSLMQY